MFKCIPSLQFHFMKNFQVSLFSWLFKKKKKTFQFAETLLEFLVSDKFSLLASRFVPIRCP